MQQYHDLLKHIIANGIEKEIARVQERKVFLVTKCDLIFKMGFLW